MFTFAINSYHKTFFTYFSMEIQDIKEQLKIETVLSHYNLQADKNNRLLCPFHKDKIPSLQIYPKTDTYCCFSSNCNAGTGDQIQFVELMEKCSKHEALQKSKELLTEINPKQVAPASNNKVESINYEKVFKQLQTNLKKSIKAKAYLESRHLGNLIVSNDSLVGFNGGAYKDLKYCVIFPLRDKKGQVVSLYGRSVVDNNKSKHYYLADRKGLYPKHPSAETKKLILTESIIDTATLQCSINNYSLLALYGTNGMSNEHLEAIRNLKDLEEIILFFDGDQAGIKATEKYKKELSELLPKVKVSVVNTPENEDINSLLDGHEPQILTNLLEKRNSTLTTQNPKLETENPEKIIYKNNSLTCNVWGGIDKGNLSRLRVSLHIMSEENTYKTFRDDVNLYSHSAVRKLVQNASETLEVPTTLLDKTIIELTEELEKYRMELRNEEVKALRPKMYEMSKKEVEQAEQFLKDKNLVKRTLALITQSGLVGEQKNGLMLFFLYLSRLTDDPLHAIIFGKSGSGKTYLQKRISQCLPEEAVRTVTSLTENTLYYSAKGFWKHKVLLIEDLEGVYQAFLPLREFMSNQSISKLTTDKDGQGNNVQKVLLVEGPICVSGATTQESIYEDNANRSFLLHIDETPQHLNEVMTYQRKQKADLIDEVSQEEAKQLLQNAQRLLSNIRVVNPYAMELKIPDLVFKKLRTNMHYLKLIEIITFYNQKQRKVKHNSLSGSDYIETEIQDIEWANWLVRDSLLRKSDELGGELRDFFERLKRTIPEGESFYSKTIREHFRMNRMKVNRYMRSLEGMGYLEQTGGNRKHGFEYVIKSYDEYEELKKGINILDENLAKLREKVSVTQV